MSAKLRLNARVRRLIHYIDDLENGSLQIPIFQRNFIWSNNNKLDLFDSLKCGYPIGSILFWKPDSADYMTAENIGVFVVPEKKDDFYYILDGFQRLATILGCLIDPQKTSLKYNSELLKEFSIYYDLETEEFFFPRSISNVLTHQVPVYQLLDTRVAFLFEGKLRMNGGYSDEEINCYINNYIELGTTLIDYTLPSIDMMGGKIEEVVEVFSRINSKGADISPDWMVSALTYSNKEGFRLGSEIDNLLEELKLYNFNSVKRELIFQCITNSFGKVYFDTKIEVVVKKDDFISVARKSINSIKKAVKFLFEELLVVESKLLPYGIQLVFITDFFFKLKNPTSEQLDKLKNWFWITTYANYFTIYSLSKQREAYHAFQNFLKDPSCDPVYNDKVDVKFETTEFPAKIFYGSVRAKALLLFMLNYKRSPSNQINAEDIDGIIINHLFHDIRDESKGTYNPENVIAFLKTEKNISLHLHKKKDLSLLIFERDKALKRHFITSDMMSLFDNGIYTSFEQKRNILELRKEFIVEQEKQFVEKLGLTYTSPFKHNSVLTVSEW
jgi:hypothetical protein